MKAVEQGATKVNYRFKTLLKAPLNLGCYIPARPGVVDTDFDLVWDPRDYTEKESLSTRGGILADEMGSLGGPRGHLCHCTLPCAVNFRLSIRVIQLHQ